MESLGSDVRDQFMTIVAELTESRNGESARGGARVMVAIGSIVTAGMRQVGYTRDFAAGVIANDMLSAGFGPVMFLILGNVILLIGGQFTEPSGLPVIAALPVFPSRKNWTSTRSTWGSLWWSTWKPG